MRLLLKFGLTVAMLVTLLPAFAHHSMAMFEMSKTQSIEGTVKEVQWTNPHVWFQIMVKDAATGKDLEWSIEADSPNVLTRRGWTRKSVQAGDRIVMEVHPLKSGVEHGGSMASATVNGKRIGNSGAPPRAGGPSP